MSVSELPSGTPYFEQRLFGWSPFGVLATSAIYFAILFGLYLASAALAQMPAVQWTGHGFAFHNGAWPALVLSLLIATALGAQRYTRLKDCADRLRYITIFSGGIATATRLSAYAPEGINLPRATIVGFFLGLLASVAILASQSDARTLHPLVMAWFVLAICISAMMFTRGVELSRISAIAFSATLRDELAIDLLRADRLAVLGRSAARGSLVWFLVSAVTCLFFVGGTLDLVSVAIMLACAGMGLWIFLRVMLQIHRKIVTEKTQQIEHIRCEIDRERAAMKTDPQAATRIQGMLAYEARLQSAPEWPFDQPTLVRVCASALIVTVPWFGQAVAGYAIEHLAR